MSEEQDTCDHYDAQVAVRMHDIHEGGEGDECDWCGSKELAGGKLFVKSERHSLMLCESCKNVLGLVL